MIDNVYPTRTAAALAAAARIESALLRQLATKESTAFVVSGGRTPIATFAYLAQRRLDWHRVSVLPSDERWVPTDCDESNEKMMRENLVTSRAADLRLLPLYEHGSQVEDRCVAVDEIIRGLPLPFACALLGMGEDGHFASLFPGTSKLQQGLDPDSASLCIPANAPVGPHSRVSLTLSALTMSDEILLLVYGEEKRAIIEQASRSESDLPVSALFSQQNSPVRVFWAP